MDSVNPAESPVNPAERLLASPASSAMSSPSKSSQIGKLTEQLNNLVSQYQAAELEYNSAQSGLKDAIWVDKTKQEKANKAAEMLNRLNGQIKFLGGKIDNLQT